MKKGTTTPTLIQSFLDEPLLEILTTVDSRSFCFLYLAKMMCKHIQRFERVNPLTSWRRHEKVYKFMNGAGSAPIPRPCTHEGCDSTSNRYNNSKLGIDYLKTAISKDHQESMYIYSAILVCQGV
ncbi:F-box protein [Pyrus ussuriensis x Pyrus communis]|uniref:F-box protein n=1 Tax=Pyrus ussuriensis x Pyrus communis TaxID=2448454 RepID=A0A5N5FLC6_9ROSA|nr:F-box protein [Pyrus ussuriensis x Pyrus communis]